MASLELDPPAARFRRSRSLAHLAGFGALLAACASGSQESVPQALSSPATPEPPPAIMLSVVSTNDLHGHLEALPRIGGFVTNLRRAREADGGGTLLLDAGDTFQGELASNLTEGAVVVDAYNLLGYDAAAIGNHEFDFGPVGPAVSPRPGEDPRGALIARAAQAQYPLLAANLIDTAAGRPFSAPSITPSALLEVAGIRVGLVGVTTLETTQSVLAAVFAGLSLDPLAESITRQARELRDRGATVVIAIAHAGGRCESFTDPDDHTSCDQNAEIFKVAAELEAGLVDAIVAGHTHRELAHRVNGIPIIEAGSHGRLLGRVDLFVDAKSRRVVGHQLHAPVEVCPKSEGEASCAAVVYEGAPVSEDQRVVPLVSAALEVAAELREQELGVTLLAPFGRAVGVESPLSNLVADLMRLARPEVDVALMHAGGLRANLPEGALRYGDLYETYPRDSTFAITTLTGSELTAALEENFVGPGGLFASISGALVEGRCESGRLSVTLRREDGHLIAPTARLVVATNNLLAEGARGPLGGQPWRVEEGPPIREELARVLRERGGTLTPEVGVASASKRLRVSLPGPAPVRCEPLTVAEER